jgi:hypothetical protein
MPADCQPGGAAVTRLRAGPTTETIGEDLVFPRQGATVRDFSGNEVRVVEVADLGTLVSVAITLTVDSGSLNPTTSPVRQTDRCPPSGYRTTDLGTVSPQCPGGR